MGSEKIPPGLVQLLQKTDFISVGTADEHGQPSVANKFILKIEGNSVYIVDLIKGRTWRNLQYNPLISLTVMDEDNLRNYQINGTASVLEAGSELDRLLAEFADKQVLFATDRIISGVQQLKPHKEQVFPSVQAKVVYKVTVNEVVEVGPTARIKKEAIEEAGEGFSFAAGGFRSRVIKQWRYSIEKNKKVAVGIAFVLILLIGILDYVTGDDVELSILFLLPVIMVELAGGRRLTSIAMYASALLWFIATEANRGWVFPWGIIAWNTLVRLGFFWVIVRLIYALRNGIEQEKKLSRTDFLTGVSNSRHFSELLAAELKRLERDGRAFTLAYLDIDNFKEVNDRSGHTAGDALLRLAADTLKNSFRQIDAVGRLGGDEFAILLPLTGQEQARFALERARDALLDAVRKQYDKVTFSIGAVTFLSAAASSDEAIAQVDGAMYEVKRSGKNSIRYGTFGGRDSAPVNHSG